jgi:hypothetical protein
LQSQTLDAALSPRIWGLTQAAARILRFDRTIRLIGAGRMASLADLATTSGHADQGHLSREFRIFTGSALMAFLRRRLPDEGGFLD